MNEASTAPPERTGVPSRERIATVVAAVVDRVREAIVEQRVTPQEYAAAKEYLIEVGEAGEWPLFGDVFFESTVETIHSAAHGIVGSIEGPYFVPGAPRLERPYRMPMRDGEGGEVFFFSGTVTSTDGTPLPGAEVELWQCDDTGTYSGIPYPDGRALPPAYNLRGRLQCDDDGRFEVRTIVPVPYEIPKEGPTGTLLAAAGWHAFRPAHLHVLVSAVGHRTLTSQPYLSTSPYLDSDVANAVKPELVVEVVRHDGAERALDAPFSTASHHFRLAPA